jgi:hypothetical protein
MVALPALLGPAVVFVLGPHTIFATNPGEWAVPFGDLALPWLLRTAGIHWLVLVAVGCAIAVLSERLTRAYSALLLALGLLLWGQGHLWNADYGALTGEDIDLAQHAWRSPYELAAWMLGPLLALMFSRHVSRIASAAAIAFIGVQLAAAAVAPADPLAASGTRWADPPEAIYEFSTGQNVIHVVLDAFQSDVFAEIVGENRAAFDSHFSGFEYFVEHASSFPTTSFSMTAMLTGEEYRNQRPAPEFVRDAFRRLSILEKVSRAGYDVDATSIVSLRTFEQWFGPEAAPTWKGARYRIRQPFVRQEEYREVTARQLLELSLFRHAPHAIKTVMMERPGPFSRILWMGEGETPARARRHQASNSAAFFEHFTASMTVGRDRPVYKLIHVGLPHRPVVVDRECRFIGATRVSRTTFAEQARCAVKRTVEFLDRLRALGIYDSSLIVIASDHGTGLRPSGFDGRSDSLPLVAGPTTRSLPVIAGAAKALMLVKRPHRSGPVVITSTPTSHADLPATILDVLDLPGGSAEDSMFRRNPEQPRPRSFGMYDLDQRFPDDYVDRMDLLSINRRVIDAAGWNLERAMVSPMLKLPDRDVDFLARGTSVYLGPGWSREQRDPSGGATFVRALTRHALLLVPVGTDARELVLRVKMSASGAAVVEVDGRPSGRLTPIAGEGYREYSIRLPPDPSRPPVSQVTLTFETIDREGFGFRLDGLALR